jgi:putative SOS response-associated peptidase YedK
MVTAFEEEQLQRFLCRRSADNLFFRADARLRPHSWSSSFLPVRTNLQAATRINAVGETLAEKPAFRDAPEKWRCIIAADGFYEWKKRDASPWLRCYQANHRADRDLSMGVKRVRL